VYKLAQERVLLNDSTPLPEYIATRAAQWGADQELKECCLLLDSGEHAASYGCHDGDSLRAIRRPKPLSLKKQACAALDTYIYGNPDHDDKQNTYNTIRRALEALPE
jgi:hypothetical protein